MTQIKNMIIQSNSSLVDVMKLIDQNEKGFCFVLDQERLVGVITDGDVRRSILAGVTLSDPASLVMKRDYFFLSTNSTIELIQKSLLKFKYIPIVDAIGRLVDFASIEKYHQIPLIKPALDGNELEYVTKCITTGWISSQGSYVAEFESVFKNYIGSENALAVSNGTVALHLALATLRIGPGDEVIVPNLTFAAPINAVLYVGATPVLVDVDQETMLIDIAAARKAVTSKTKAIIPVHLYGQPVDVSAIKYFADEFKLLIIEDCAEALGSRYKGGHVGNIGDAAIFSFFGNKTITTGEGGMLVFKEPKNHNKGQLLRDHGMSPDKRYWHDQVGFNYRLTNLQAAVGVAQMERIDFFLERKDWLSKQYFNRLKGLKNVLLPKAIQDAHNSYWLYTIILNGSASKKRDAMIELLRANGIESRPVFYPLHLMPPYQKFAQPGIEYRNSSNASEGGISLPSSVDVTEEEIERICSLITSFLI